MGSPSALVVCPGCGVERPSLDKTNDTHFNCSFECWSVFGELSAYTLAHGGSGERGPTFIHQHAVDAWQAQHIGPRTANVGAAFSLIGLYLALEKGFTGRQVQLAHMRLGKFRREWPRLDPPQRRSTFAVMDVLDADPGESRDATLMRWAGDVWASWNHAHAWTRRTCADLLDVR